MLSNWGTQASWGPAWINCRDAWMIEDQSLTSAMVGSQRVDGRVHPTNWTPCACTGAGYAGGLDTDLLSPQHTLDRLWLLDTQKYCYNTVIDI